MSSPAVAIPDLQRRPRVWRRRRFWLALCVAALLVLPPVLFECAARLLPYPNGALRDPIPSTVVLDRAGRPLAAFTAPDGAWCLPRPAQGYGRWLPQAVVAIEDARFRAHAGVDWCAVANALWQDLRARRVVRGASTITMQLQRLRQPHARSWWSKAMEALRARQIELALGKDAILAEWLERAPFGGNVVGAGAAAWRWFGVAPDALSLAQAALIAGLPQRPEYLRPDRHPERAHERRDRVLVRLHELCVIDAHELELALAEPVILAGGAPPAPEEIGALALLSDAARAHPGALTTALDLGVQRSAHAMLSSRLAALRSSGVDAGAAAVLDLQAGTWQALVSVGGPAWLDLTRTPRSTGSALKPFIYAGAFARGIATPASPLADDPAGWAGWAPVDYDHAWRGRCSAAEALRDSRNLPAMHLLEQFGVPRCAALMEAFGLTGMSAQAARSGLALAIGGAEADVRALAAAYGGLALGGRRLQPRLLSDQAPAANGPALLPAAACWAVLRALCERERTAACCPAAAGLEPAWKTGTSSGHRDAWCVAVTPRLCVAVWLGTTRGPGTPALVGGEAAAPLALALLAATDGGGPSWPVVDMGAAAGPPPSVVEAPLVITNPPSGVEVITDPDALAGRGRLALACHGGGEGMRWWFVDGAPLAAVAAGQPVWWTAHAGRHQLRVVDQGGQAAVAVVVVR